MVFSFDLWRWTSRKKLWRYKKKSQPMDYVFHFKSYRFFLF